MPATGHPGIAWSAQSVRDMPTEDMETPLRRTLLGPWNLGELCVFGPGTESFVVHGRSIIIQNRRRKIELAEGDDDNVFQIKRCPL